MKILNGKAITPDLFSEENNEDKSFSKEMEKGKEKEKEDNLIYNNNNKNNHLIDNDKIIVEKSELEQNSYYRNEIELPDSSIESEIHNYDVSYILFKFNIW